MMRELYQEILTRHRRSEMADGDGYEFLKRLRAIPGRATTPVIVSSGQLAGDAAIAGADRFLAKPFRAQ